MQPKEITIRFRDEVDIVTADIAVDGLFFKSDYFSSLENAIQSVNSTLVKNLGRWEQQ